MSEITNIVKISDELSDWQIIAQTGGFADITVRGRACFDVPLDPSLKIYARIISENTQLPIVNWTEAQRSGDDYSAVLRSVPAGGLYTIEVTACGDPLNLEWGARGECRKHIGVGDIYIIAGQSNSAGYGKTPAADIPDIRVHLLRNCMKWDLATHPMNESTRSLHQINAEGGNPGHSPWLSFAKTVLSEVNYPIGLVAASLGGSPISAWLSEDGKENLYSNMLGLIRAVGGNVKGILWYQGCNDTDENRLAVVYYDQFCRLVSSLRKDIGYDVPFITVQLNRYIAGAQDNYDGEPNYGLVREAQRRAARELDKVYIVPAIDLPLSDAIHNSTAGNITLGERCAYTALGEIYKKSVYPSAAPDIDEAYLENDRIIMRFANVRGYLHLLNSVPETSNFHFRDGSGTLPFSELRLDSANTISVRPLREISGDVYASLASLRDARMTSPFDRGTGLPALCFFDVPVKIR